ncbi:MAG TPA: hypothetical protein VIF09_01580 [Polyangiaceae bacterium]|jgi:hypothetical protein
MRDTLRSVITFTGLVVLGTLAMATGGSSSGSGGAPASTPSPCAPYDAHATGPWQYTGQVVFNWTDGSTAPPSSGTQIVSLSFNVECQEVNAQGAGQGVLLWITSATTDDPIFGTGTGAQTLPQFGSIMTMPISPPTTPSNPALPAQGLNIAFQNGTQFGVAAQNQGDFSVHGSVSPISITSSPGVMPAVQLVAPVGLVPSHPNAVVVPVSWALDQDL